MDGEEPVHVPKGYDHLSVPGVDELAASIWMHNENSRTIPHIMLLMTYNFLRVEHVSRKMLMYFPFVIFTASMPIAPT
jgi:hypothetical protein